MSTPRAVTELPVDELVDLMGNGAVEAAVELVLAPVDRGLSVAEVVRGLLAPAQAEVGARWYRTEWPSSREHRATAVADAALHRLVTRVPAPPPSAGRLAVACAPGDWHTFPCRLAAELLRRSGWAVDFLGASLPSWELTRWIADERPDAVVLTATACAGLRGVVTVAAAADEVSVPVVAGGVAMGPDSRRADALGIRWCASLDGVGRRLAAPAADVDRTDLAERVHEHDAGQLARADLIQAVVAATGADVSAGLADDAGQTVTCLCAAVLTGDRRIFADFTTWWRGYLELRGRQPEAVDAAVRALADGLPDFLPRTRRLLQQSG